MWKEAEKEMKGGSEKGKCTACSCRRRCAVWSALLRILAKRREYTCRLLCSPYSYVYNTQPVKDNRSPPHTLPCTTISKNRAFVRCCFCSSRLLHSEWPPVTRGECMTCALASPSLSSLPCLAHTLLTNKRREKKRNCHALCKMCVCKKMSLFKHNKVAF